MKRRRSKWGRLLVGASLVVGAGALPSSADAYVRSKNEKGAKLRWPSSCVPVLAYTGSPPSRMTTDTLKKAIDAATLAWGRNRVGCTGMKLAVEYSGEADGPAARDGTNRIVFRRDKWCRTPADAKMTCYDPSVLAVTTVTSSKTDGTILDADIEINAVNYKWDDMSAKGVAAGAQDFQTMLTHELGHLVGLDHTCFLTGVPPVDHAGKEVPSCSNASTQVKATVMFPKVASGDFSHRALSTDERLAMCDVYPLTTAVTNCTYATAPRPDAGALPTEKEEQEDPGDEAGGCSFGGGAGARGGGAAWLVAIAALAFWRRRR